MAEKEKVIQETREVITEPAYEVDYLLANAKEIFGVNKEVVVGALAGQTKQEYTVSEVKALIEKFLNRRVS